MQIHEGTEAIREAERDAVYVQLRQLTIAIAELRGRLSAHEEEFRHLWQYLQRKETP